MNAPLSRILDAVKVSFLMLILYAAINDRIFFFNFVLELDVLTLIANKFSNSFQSYTLRSCAFFRFVFDADAPRVVT